MSKITLLNTGITPSRNRQTHVDYIKTSNQQKVAMLRHSKDWDNRLLIYDCSS